MNTKKRYTTHSREKMQSAIKISATYCVKIDILLNKAAPGKSLNASF